MRSESSVSRIGFTFLFLLAGAGSVFAQDGKLNLHVIPRQAYVFVDDRAISEASKHPSLKLSAGEHKVELVNYGYKPATRTVTITKQANLAKEFDHFVQSENLSPEPACQ